MPVTNPATGAVLGQLPDCTASETRDAIDSAARAMVGWRARTKVACTLSCNA